MLDGRSLILGSDMKESQRSIGTRTCVHAQGYCWLTLECAAQFSKADAEAYPAYNAMLDVSGSRVFASLRLCT
jgi:hypothetical protein